jgi:hypothetical protein
VPNSFTPYQKIRHDHKAVNYVMLLATPMRREFKVIIDVRRFLTDMPYAEEVLKLALSSTDERLQKYAQYLVDALFGDDHA